MCVCVCKSCGLEFNAIRKSSARCKPCKATLKKKYNLKYNLKYMAGYYMRRSATWTDEQKRKKLDTQYAQLRAKQMAMSPEELAEWRAKKNKRAMEGITRKMSKMSPSEVKEYKAKRYRRNYESRVRKLKRMSPEDRRAYYKRKVAMAQAKHKAFKFLSNMAKMGAAVKAIACST